MACATSDLGVLGMAEATSPIAAQIVSPVELTDAVLERIRRLNVPLHAYSEVFFEQAMQIAQAREIELRSKLPLGPLHGVPIAVKDLLSIKGFATTSGSTVHRTRIAEDTSTVVRRLIAAGAIIVGKTHLSEFAFGPWGTNQGMGTPWNPWDSETHRAPGGSSSGSAVALAGGMALGAIGTDTGGSVRIPAAFCGLTGLKVTERRVSNAGLSYLSRTLDTIGPMAWSAEDAALLLQVIHGPDPLDPRTLAITSSDFIEGLGQPVKGIRIALPAANRLGPLDPHVERTIEAAMTVFGNLGCHIADLDNTPDFAADQEEAGVIMATEAFVENGEAAESDVAGDPAARGRVLRGRDIPAAHYANAMARRAVRQREFQTLFDSVDVLALPTAPVVASPVADIDEADLSPSRLTRFASYYGLCAIALPGGFTTDGLPLSIQLIAAPYREDLLLRLGVAFQQQTDWHCRRPDLSRFMH